MTSKSIVLITGGNTGIGYEVVKALLGSDRLYHILLAGRDIKKAEEAAKSSTAEVKSESTVEAVQIDVEDDGSISKAFEEVSSKHSKIDCLINNAGEETVVILSSWWPMLTTYRSQLRSPYSRWSHDCTRRLAQSVERQCCRGVRHDSNISPAVDQVGRPKTALHYKRTFVARNCCRCQSPEIPSPTGRLAESKHGTDEL